LQDAFEYDFLLAELVEQCVIFPNQPLRYLNDEGGLSFNQSFLLAQKYLLEVLNVPMDRLIGQFQALKLPAFSGFSTNRNFQTFQSLRSLPHIRAASLAPLGWKVV
jgi:hypothetical protein